MARPERTLDPAASPLHALAADLRALRAQAGNPKYLQMQRISGRSRTALADAAGGDRLPTWETLAAFVRACGEDPTPWRRRWQQVHDQLRQPADEPRQADDPPAARVPHDSKPVVVPELAETRQSVDGPAIRAEILLQMWEEQRRQARQNETQRAVITGVIAVLCLAAFTYLATGHHANRASLLVAFAVCILGLFGVVVTAKYYERFIMHMDLAQAIRGRLDELFPDLRLAADWSANRARHRQSYAVLYRVRLHHLWIGLHGAIAVAGAVSVVLVLTR